MKKTFVIVQILVIFICLQGFTQNKIDSTQLYINATLNAIRTIVVKSIEQNQMGQIVLSKEHPLIADLRNFEDKDLYKNENYTTFGVFDNCKIDVYTKSTIQMNNFETALETLPGDKDNLQWVKLGSVKSHIKSGSCELKGNYLVNGNSISFKDAKILCENMDSLSLCKIIEGSVCYFNDIKFQYTNSSWLAKSSPPILPVIDISDITAFTGSSAKVDAFVIRDGGASVTERGICYDTSENPQITNNKTSEGNGKGRINSVLNGLTANTTYYVRAYASNISGTGYSEQIKFTTMGSDNGTFNYSGETYSFKTIGTQTWMTENMAFLPDDITLESYITYTVPEYSVPLYNGKDGNAAKSTDIYKTFGVLYNWPAAMKVCPCGWHLPSDSEWNTLEKHLGLLETGSDSRIKRSRTEVANQMKETGTIHWKNIKNKSNNGNNYSGFNALPGGYSDSRYSSDGRGYSAYFWSSSETNENQALNRKIESGLYFDGILKEEVFKNLKYSVRCIKD
jgi:uncharacterized protein (TIGR02145 family)